MPEKKENLPYREPSRLDEQALGRDGKLYVVKMRRNGTVYWAKDIQGPLVSASDYNEGKKKLGNDKKWYIVVVGTNGVKRWKKHTTKKEEKEEKAKKERPSPSAPARWQLIGTEMVGNDGNMYKIIQTKNGVKRWQKKK